jgi:hypothetical protein
MAKRTHRGLVLSASAAAALLFSAGSSHADDPADTQGQLRQLQQQNQILQQQLQKQQTLIESLSQTVKDIQAAETRRNREMDDLKGESTPPSKAPASFGMSKVNISGEGGVGFFDTGSKGEFPNAEFRLDEAKLFVEAPVCKDLYFFGELNLMTRDAQALSLQLGEVYLDFENVSSYWNLDHLLNVRAGRMYIPFGEEYLSRYAIDNPLISHSLSDVWGVDQGLELYGKYAKLSYAVAVQSGGPSGVRDFSSDKSVAGRISFDPAHWLHLSVSGMRTGDLHPPDDYWSALWFGNGWFMPIDPGHTTDFHANLAEADVEVRLPHGHVAAFGGYARYDDNDPLANNGRDIYYYSIEAVHDVVGNLYAAARFSQILAPNGYPIAGNGNKDDSLFSGALTDDLWRLSLGLGYRCSQNLIFKTEYSFERGSTIAGPRRTHEDLFALEAAFRF